MCRNRWWSASSRPVSKRRSRLWCATGSSESGFDKLVGRRIVLTGGACQLPGTRELAALILDKQIRVGRPLRIAGLAEATNGPAFATTAGLVHFALSERAELPRHGRALQDEPNGLIGRVGHWIREYLTPGPLGVGTAPHSAGQTGELKPRSYAEDRNDA